jgi:hypothetical protein
MKTENEITVVLIKDEGNKLRVLYHILVDNIAKILPCDRVLFRIIRGIMIISPSFIYFNRGNN